jgi:hypothetical protein
MDNDSGLIFESYISSKNNLLLEQDKNKSGAEQVKDWLVFVGKVLDPTGISNYWDLKESIQNYIADQSAENLIYVVLNLYAALPNLGLLAAGVGGIPWIALKAAAKGAIKSGRVKDAAPIANQILSYIKKSKELQYGFEKILDILVKNKTITSKDASTIRTAVQQGGIKTKIMGRGVETAAGKVSGKEARQATKEYLSKYSPLNKRFIPKTPKIEIPQLLVRAGKDMENVEYPNVLPQRLFSAKPFSISKDNDGQPVGNLEVGDLFNYSGDKDLPKGLYRIVP